MITCDDLGGYQNAGRCNLLLLMRMDREWPISSIALTRAVISQLIFLRIDESQKTINWEAANGSN